MLEKTKGRVLVQLGEPDRSDLFIPPTIIEADSSDVLFEQEIFGPILPILIVNNFEEALNYVKQQEKSLAAYIFTKDSQKADRLIQETRSGNVLVNDVLLNFSVDTLPFGKSCILKKNLFISHYRRCWSKWIWQIQRTVWL